MSKNPLYRSFVYAFKGLGFAFKERNFRLHIVSASLVTIAGFYLGLNSRDWIILILCMAGVIALEIVNTSIEKIIDLVSPQHHELAGAAKDLAAAAVLVFSIGSAIVGILVFSPYFFN